jgi:regulator of protease activity HflC (stomatin/prohibitin superfamily)
MPSSTTVSPVSGRTIRIVIWLIVIVVAVLLFLGFAQQHVYFLRKVDTNQLGVQKRGGQIIRVVPPGIYSDVALFAELETFSTRAYQFTVSDAELITSDNQRIGVTVSGSVFRPDYTRAHEIPSLWTKYSLIYLSDEALQKVANDLSAQAMKVCVGGRPFRESIIGAGRDELRNCIDDELNKLADPYGLNVANLTVPNVALSEEVQGLLDSITKSRLETEKATQDRLKAMAEGEAQKAAQEAEIRVEQSRAQEEAKQKTTLAQLTSDQLKAERGVIEAQKANDLLSAQRDLEINKAMAVAAIEKAKADLAREIALAELYATNNNYYLYQMALANASAIKDTDKLIFVPAGTFPQLIFGENLKPVVPVNNPEAIPQ